MTPGRRKKQKEEETKSFTQRRHEVLLFLLCHTQVEEKGRITALYPRKKIHNLVPQRKKDRKAWKLFRRKGNERNKRNARGKFLKFSKVVKRSVTMRRGTTRKMILQTQMITKDKRS